MNAVWEWLLDLEDIRLEGDAPADLQWMNAPPAWLIAVLAIAIVFLVTAVYARERVSAGRRVVLIAHRSVLLGLLLACLCGPSLVVRRMRVEPSFVALLVDVSQSMGRRDMPNEDKSRGVNPTDRDGGRKAPSARPARLEIAAAALRGHSAASPLESLLQRHAVELYRFAEGVTSVASASMPEEAGVLARHLDQLAPTGTSTDLPGAIRGVLDRSRGRRLAAIILASDGRSNSSSVLEEAANLASARQVPIHAFKIGSPLAPRDVELGLVRFDRTVFLHDLMTIAAPVSGTGLVEAETVRVSLMEDATGEVLAQETATLAPDAPRQEVILAAKPARVGWVTYRVEVAPLAEEEHVEDNAERIEIRAVDSRICVLYVERQPRFEYRYLKNALIREPTVEAGVLLLDADERFVQEGTEPIRRFPETPEELHRFDVVLFGDVDPRGEWLSESQMTMLLDYVGHAGGAFGLIAGDRSTPHALRATPLERLLPVRLGPIDDPTFRGVWTTGFRPYLTSEGTSHTWLHAIAATMRFERFQGSPANIFSNLPSLYWFMPTAGPKPGARVLAAFRPAAQTGVAVPDDDEIPILVVGRYGAGRVFFQGTDDTWRWRSYREGGFPVGELFHDTYWVHVVRMLSQPERSERGGGARVRTDRRGYEFGEQATILVEVLDASLENEWGETVELMVAAREPDEAHSTDQPEHVVRSSSNPEMIARIEARRVGASHTPSWQAVWVPPGAGTYRVDLEEAARNPLAEEGATAWFRVRPPDLELRRIEADHDALRLLTARTGGVLFEPANAGEVFSQIPDRSLRVPDDLVEPLWDTRLILLLLALTISSEWVLRKAFHLL